MREIIMGYQGEMSLKGLNRNQFESAMMKILRYRLKTVGKFKVYCTQSTFYMEPEEEDVDMDLAFDRVRTVFGLAALSRAVVCEKDFDTICRTAEEYLGDSLHGIKTLAGDEGLAALSGGNTIGNAHHAAAHQHREQHIGGVVPDILLRLGVGHHKQVGAAGIGGDLLGQSFNF